MYLLKQIQDSGVVAVIRGVDPEHMVPITEALYEGGIRALEITVDTPKVLSLIEKVNDQLGEKAIVGAGTVLDSETARAAIMAGAKFIFSPTVNIDTIKVTKRYGVVSIPGALTPTEILTAYENGADMIKVFPANIFGPRYFKDIKGPLPHIPLMPTGGINLNNVQDYIQAGALAVGVGGSLISNQLDVSDKGLTDLSQKAKQFVEEVKKSRE